MIVLIHGDDTVSSRVKLQEEKVLHKDENIQFLDGTKITSTQLHEVFSSLSLFTLGKTVIIENLIGGPKSKAKDQSLSILSTYSQNHSIILWEKSEVTKTILTKYFTKSKVYLYTYPKILFSFLDSIGRRSPGEILQMFHELLRHTDAEMVYSMLVRQWRFLLIAKDLGRTGLGMLSPWQAHKFVDQAGTFSIDQLQQSYRQLLSVDANIKSGQTPLSMTQLLDIFLVNL